MCKVKPTALYPLIMQQPDANYSKCILGTSSAIYVLKLCYKNFPLLIINDIKKEYRQPVQTKKVWKAIHIVCSSLMSTTYLSTEWIPIRMI